MINIRYIYPTFSIKNVGYFRYFQ